MRGSLLKILYKILIFLLVFSCNLKNEKAIIEITDNKLSVNGEDYFLKGVCYHPVPVNSIERSFETLDEDLKLMSEAGINTIRLYAPIDDTIILDKIYESGLKVIIGFGYNQGGKFDIVSGSFIDYVKKYKNHQAILFWELGNEYNYHPEWFENDIKNWYNSLNDAANLIHKEDLFHPVATAHGEIPDSIALKIVKDIDIWGINVYRWDNPSSLFTEWEKISNKPIYLSEAGADSYMTISKNDFNQGDNQAAQAQAVDNILKSIFVNKDKSLGVTLFSFSDGWWKAGEPEKQNPGGWAPNSSGVPYDGTPNEEYWGILTIERNKKQAFEVVKKYYKNNTN